MIFEWLVNYLLHSSILLGAAAAATCAIKRLREPAIQDVIWKAALVGGILTAGIQVVGPHGSPWQPVAFEPGATAASPAVSDPMPVAALPTPAQPDVSTTASTAAERGAPGKRPHDGRPSLPSPRALAVAAWALGAFFLLLGLVRAVLLQRRLLSDRNPVTLDRIAHLIPDRQGPRVRRVSTSHRLDNPLVTAAGEIVVPEAFFELPADQQRGAIAHELGHIARRDPSWRLVIRLINAVLFIQPLNRLAARRLHRSAEILSDRYAVRLTGDRRGLAQSLAWFAAVRYRPLPATACAMVSGSGSALLQRISDLVENRTMPLSNARQFWSTITMIIAIGSITLPGISDGRDRTDAGNSRNNVHMRITNDDGHSEIHVSHRDDRRRLELDAEGRIEFSADGSDIVGLGEDGYFDLTVSASGTTRRVEISAEDGGLQRRYWVDGKTRPYEDEARGWLAGIMPEIFRLTGIDAAARVGRLLERGVEAVITEIDLIESDLVARIYSEELAQQAELDAAELEVLLETLREGISSDLELRLALTALMEHQTLNEDNWETLLEATGMLGSDLEQRLALTRAATSMPTERRLVEAYVTAADHIGSDLEQRLALEAIGKHLAVADQSLLIQVIDATETIGSDLEQRLALQALAPALSGAAVFEAYIRAVGKIGSDLEARLAYQHLLAQEPDHQSVVAMVEAAADSIGSDLELRLLLSDVLETRGDEPAIREAVVKAADSIGSSFERNQLLGTR